MLSTLRRRCLLSVGRCLASSPASAILLTTSIRHHSSNTASTSTSSSSSNPSASSSPRIPSDGLTLKHFVQGSVPSSGSEARAAIDPLQTASLNSEAGEGDSTAEIPLNSSTPVLSNLGLTYAIETYGCAMNESDSEIIASILQAAGLQQHQSKTALSGSAESAADAADVILLNTCAIREGAEAKIWGRLDELKSLKRHRERSRQRSPLVGVLGCMAERLKEKLLEAEKKVDLVVGPDAYRDIPRILEVCVSAMESGKGTGDRKSVINTQLSIDETYSDVTPVRRNPESKQSFVSIMRGCNAYCSYCVVPFTRGNERSRPIDSILSEVKQLSEQGYKEVLLLGQNVNSYNYTAGQRKLSDTKDALTPGFVNIARRPMIGIGFTELLDKVSQVDPELRIRFISPHPKDYPIDLIRLMAERSNICKSVHMPAQSGSTAVLQKMRRGYTREAYLNLIAETRRHMPGVAISTDMISGFCGETEADHQETLSLFREVQFDTAFMFAYSQREKTHAHRNYPDDVPEQVKLRRLREVNLLFHELARAKNEALLGTVQIALVEGLSKRSDLRFSARTDTNKRIHFDVTPLGLYRAGMQAPSDEVTRVPKVGDYVAVLVDTTSSVSLGGIPLGFTSIRAFEALHPRGTAMGNIRIPGLQARVGAKGPETESENQMGARM